MGGKSRYRNEVEAFWSHVKTGSFNDCWEWKGSSRGTTRGKVPYGLFAYFDLRVSAHRYSYQLHYGKIPDGLDVLHSCDNPRCVNPLHLRAGTHQENMKERDVKGHNIYPFGEHHYKAKMTPEKVREMRRKHTEGVNYSQLGREYGMSPEAARAIVLKINWKHVE